MSDPDSIPTSVPLKKRTLPSIETSTAIASVSTRLESTPLSASSSVSSLITPTLMTARTSIPTVRIPGSVPLKRVGSGASLIQKKTKPISPMDLFSGGVMTLKAVAAPPPALIKRPEKVFENERRKPAETSTVRSGEKEAKNRKATKLDRIEAKMEKSTRVEAKKEMKSSKKRPLTPSSTSSSDDESESLQSRTSSPAKSSTTDRNHSSERQTTFRGSRRAMALLPTPNVSEPPPLVTMTKRPWTISCYNALDYVSDHVSKYSTDWTEMPKVTLSFPGEQGLATEIFPLISPSTHPEDYSPLADSVQTMRIILQQWAEQETEPLSTQLRRALYNKDLDRIQSLSNEFNQFIQKFKEKGMFEPLNGSLPEIAPERDLGNASEPWTDSVPQGTLGSYIQVQHVLNQSYDRVMDRPDLLNQYKGFSHQVYGETKACLMTQIFATCRLSAKKSFIDLGSGLGTVPLQAAAETGCTAYGVELMPIPAYYGRALHLEFMSRCRRYGLQCGPVTLLHGDFCALPQVAQLLETVDVVFVNNYVFEPALNQKLLELFIALKEGAYVVSFTSFAPLHQRITLHNRNSISSIFRVKRYEYTSGSVSWTTTGGHYYIHRVDRRRLREWEEQHGSSL